MYVTFRSVIHFEFIFVKSVRSRFRFLVLFVCLFVFAGDVKLFSYHLWKNYFSPILSFGGFDQNTLENTSLKLQISGNLEFGFFGLKSFASKFAVLPLPVPHNKKSHSFLGPPQCACGRHAHTPRHTHVCLHMVLTLC